MLDGVTAKRVTASHTDLGRSPYSGFCSGSGVRGSIESINGGRQGARTKLRYRAVQSTAAQSQYKERYLHPTSARRESSENSVMCNQHARPLPRGRDDGATE